MYLTAEVRHAADELTKWASHVSNETKNLADEVTSQLELSLSGRSKINKASIVGLDQCPSDFLTRNVWAVGAGAFFAGDFVEGGGPALEWLFRKGSADIERLDFDLTPGSNRYYDYEKLPFYSTAASTGEQALWGPYIDYLGFEEYIITFSAPLFVHGEFAGVAGCDIRIKDLEPLIMPHLRDIPDDAALVNSSDRVILGNSGRYLVGDRIKSGPSNERRMALDVPHLGLSLVYIS